MDSKYFAIHTEIVSQEYKRTYIRLRNLEYFVFSGNFFRSVSGVFQALLRKKAGKKTPKKNGKFSGKNGIFEFSKSDIRLYS